MTNGRPLITSEKMDQSGTVRFAGFWVRWLAELVDSIILTVVATLLELMFLGAWYWIRILAMGESAGSFSESYNAFMFQVFNALLYLVLAVPYYIYAHYRYGTTLGKVWLNIYVVNHSDHRAITLRQSVIRCLSYAVSYLPLMTGYLMAAFHPEKRALHDLIAGTVSVRRAKVIQPEVV